MRRRLSRTVIGVAMTVALFAGTLLVFTPASAQSVTFGTVVVNTPFLNVRNGPGAQFLVIGVVPGGTELPVTGITRDRDWWGVQTPFGAGFVFADFVLYRGDGSVVPFVGVPGSATSQPPFAIVLAQSLNVRAGPSVNFASLGSVPQQTVLPIVGQNVATGWYHVSSPFGPGWVANDEVALGGDTSIIPKVDETGAGSLPATTISLPTTTTTTTPTFSPPAITVPSTAFGTVPGPTGRIGGDNTRVRLHPHRAAAVIGLLNNGFVATIVGRDINFEFYQINTPFGVGWVRSSVFRPHRDVDIFKLPLTAIEGFTIGVTSPTSVAAIPSTIPTGVTTTGTTPIIPPPSDVVIGGGIVSGGIVVVNTPSLNMRSGPGSQFTVVAVVSGGNEFPVVGRLRDSTWYKVSTSVGQGWLFHEFVLFRGNPDGVPVITS